MDTSPVSDGYLELPATVRIGCYTFVIEVAESNDSIAQGEFGHTNFLSQKIRLSPGMTPQNLANTVLHECIHGIHWVYGLVNGQHEEESFTNLGANGLCAFFQDNPSFVEWFIKNNAL